MIEIELDGKKVEIAEGSTVMHAAEKANTFIPHFCYHKKLSISANCRMCLVEIENAPKPMPACATTVAKGMVVHTHSDKAIQAQQSVMEFLLINHPLDCPICDQGGECKLQDVAVGYGSSVSRYAEDKRVVTGKDVGPLISMQEMSRCIHCTRCVRFGQEIAGVMELGMPHRGEHSTIETFLAGSIDSELSGNMIDLCPVGALTSKPFRYSARTWELSRRKSISPHDSTGANLIVQVKNNRVMRVLPLENEAVNECWLADRDRFSYEALNSPERLTVPMIKHAGEWMEVDWKTALEHVANGLRQISAEFGAASIGALVSPHSTLEELHLAVKLMQGLGSPNIDYRLRHAEFVAPEGVHTLGMSIASLSQLQSVFVLGSNLRKDHPLFAQRIRQATRHHSCVVSALVEKAQNWAMPVANWLESDATQWTVALAGVVAAVAAAKGINSPVEGVVNAQTTAIAQSLMTDKRSAILLGNAAVHHAKASSLLAMANWIAEHTGAVVGHLTEAANTVGAQWVGAVPGALGMNAAQMLNGSLKAVLLLNNEPKFDSAAQSMDGLSKSKMVVSLSPFNANSDCCNVMLPIAPFTETSGTYINAEGRVQSFHAVVKPLDETRPAWKVWRVLANMLDVPEFDFASSKDVLQSIPGFAFSDTSGDVVSVTPERLSNRTRAAMDITPCEVAPIVASIYQIDGMVRRAKSLQLTADGRQHLSSERVIA